MRIQPWYLAAAALPLIAACSHAKPAVRAEAAPPAPPPMAMTQPVEAPPPVPTPPPAKACISDDECGASELCASAKCTAISAGLAECREASAHFDFDRADLHDVDLPVLQREARCLQNLPPEATLVAGNCDERGTVAYNIVLGLRRAHTVARYLENLGVPEKQLTEVSYGEELGVCSEHDESCWMQNRRTDVERGAKARDIVSLIERDQAHERAEMARAARVTKPATAVGRRAPTLKQRPKGAKRSATRAPAK